MTCLSTLSAVHTLPSVTSSGGTARGTGDGLSIKNAIDEYVSAKRESKMICFCKKRKKKKIGLTDLQDWRNKSVYEKKVGVGQLWKAHHLLFWDTTDYFMKSIHPHILYYRGVFTAFRCLVTGPWSAGGTFQGETLMKWQYFECRVCPPFFKSLLLGLFFIRYKKKE